MPGTTPKKARKLQLQQQPLQLKPSTEKPCAGTTNSGKTYDVEFGSASTSSSLSLPPSAGGAGTGGEAAVVSVSRVEQKLKTLFPSREAFVKAVVGLAIFFLCAYLSFVTSAIAGYRVPRVQILPATDGEELTGGRLHSLPDLGHDLVSFLLRLYRHGFTQPSPEVLASELDYVDMWNTPNVFVKVLGNIATAFIFLHPQRHMILKRAPVILGLVMLLRILCILATTLPDASPACVAQFGTPDAAYKSAPMFPTVFWRGLVVFSSPGKHITCGDMVFSGHTCCLYMASLIFLRYCRPECFQTTAMFNPFPWLRSRVLCTLVRWAVCFASYTGIAFILATKLHYTIDILLAVVITHFTWRLYFDWIETDRFRKRMPHFLLWLEGLVDSPTPPWVPMSWWGNPSLKDT